MMPMSWEWGMRDSDLKVAAKPEKTFRKYTPDARTILDIVYRSRHGCLYVSHRDARHANAFLGIPPEYGHAGEPASGGWRMASLKAMAAKGWSLAKDAMSRATRRRPDWG
jgi:hypothetical protein